MKQHIHIPTPKQALDAVEAILLPDVCTAEVLAEYLQVSVADILAAIEAGEIPARKMGSRYLVSGERLRDELASGSRNAVGAGR